MLNVLVRCEMSDQEEEFSLKDEYTVLYQIDVLDRIIFVNDAWLTFASESDDYSLEPDQVLNKSLWDFIVDPETRLLYQNILEKVRSQQDVSVYLRCDAPETRRLVKLEICRLPDDVVQFSSTILERESRDYVPLLDVTRDRSNEFLTICGWCKKVKVFEQGWFEVEEAVDLLGLFQSARLPQLSHGICGSCYQSVLTTLE